MIAEERVRINTAEFINHSMRSLAFMGPVINHGLPSEARGSGPGRAMDRRPPAHRAPWAQARKPANGWSERFTFIKVSNGRTRICYAPVAVPLEITVYLPIVGGVALGTATPYAQEYKGFGVQLRKTRALKHPPFVVTRQTVSWAPDGLSGGSRGSGGSWGSFGVLVGAVLGGIWALREAILEASKTHQISIQHRHQHAFNFRSSSEISCSQILVNLGSGSLPNWSLCLNRENRTWHQVSNEHFGVPNRSWIWKKKRSKTCGDGMQPRFFPSRAPLAWALQILGSAGGTQRVFE